MHNCMIPPKLLRDEGVLWGRVVGQGRCPQLASGTYKFGVSPQQRTARTTPQSVKPKVLSRGAPEHPVGPRAPPVSLLRPLSALRHFDHRSHKHLHPSGGTHRPIRLHAPVRHGWSCRRRAPLHDFLPAPRPSEPRCACSHPHEGREASAAYLVPTKYGPTRVP